jgi:hypothetical protein
MHRFLTPGRMLVVAVVVLLLLSLAPLRVAAAVGSPVAGLVDLLVRPVAGPLRGVAASVEPGVGGEVAGVPAISEHHPGHAIRRVRELEQQVAVLERELAIFRRLELEGHVVDAVWLRAPVTHSAPEPDQRVLTIGRGSSSGVQEQQAVVHGVHLVGLVNDVTPASATVQLITASNMQLQAHLAGAQMDQPLLTEPVLLNIDESGEHFVGLVRSDIPVQTGMVAHLADVSWPPQAQRAFVIGEVTTVRPSREQPQLMRELVVTPQLSLSRLREVDVLVPE